VAKADALAQLKDIHLPDAISWWPLAPGWYGLMVLALLFACALIYLIYKHHHNALAKKQALVLLNSYIMQYEKDRNAQLASARISELLRRVALVYYPRHEVASLHGDAWVEFLNQSSKKINFNPVKSMLLESPFKTAETINLNPLIQRTKAWIIQRRVPCSN
jgi:hypothetical protein